MFVTVPDIFGILIPEFTWCIWKTCQVGNALHVWTGTLDFLKEIGLK
jgi:hypothetical protein